MPSIYFKSGQIRRSRIVQIVDSFESRVGYRWGGTVTGRALLQSARVLLWRNAFCNRSFLAAADFPRGLVKPTPARCDRLSAARKPRAARTTRRQAAAF